MLGSLNLCNPPARRKVLNLVASGVTPYLFKVVLNQVVARLAGLYSEAIAADFAWAVAPELRTVRRLVTLFVPSQSTAVRLLRLMFLPLSWPLRVLTSL